MTGTMKPFDSFMRPITQKKVRGRTEIYGLGRLVRMKKKGKKTVDQIIHAGNDGCAELSLSPGLSAYAVTSGIVVFLLAACTLLLSAAA